MMNSVKASYLAKTLGEAELSVAPHSRVYVDNFPVVL